MLRTTLGRITLQSTFILAFLAVVMIVTATVFAPEYRLPELLVQEPVPPLELTAEAWAVVDVLNNTMVLSENSTATLPIASVTKLVTAAALRSDFDMASTTEVTWADIATEGRAGSLVPGDEFSYQTLLFPLLLESSNDAAETLRRAAGDNALLLAMNDLVGRLDLQNTVFADPSGLSSENVSTARNLASLASDLYYEQPHVLDITGLSQYLYEDYGWQNTSPFIADSAYEGGKHGFTPAAGRTALVYFKEAYPDGERVLVAYVILGSTDLVADVAALRAHTQTYTVYR